MWIRRFCIVLLFVMTLVPLGFSENSMVVRFVSGEQVILSLDERPVITFDDETVNVEDRNYAFEDVLGYYFDLNDTGIGELVVSNQTIIFGDGHIEIENCDSNDKIAIFSIAGQDVDVRQIYSGGTITLDITTMEKGVYVLHINSRSVKFYKK